VIRLRLALWGVIALGCATGAASCQSPPAVSNEELLQAVRELRAEVAALRRTVERLERELAEAKAAPAPPQAPPGAKEAPASKAARIQCAGTTASGARCKRSVREGSRFCWQHAGQ
jgi:uncharacterized small protein (DUF1192 family)